MKILQLLQQKINQNYKRNQLGGRVINSKIPTGAYNDGMDKAFELFTEILDGDEVRGVMSQAYADFCEASDNINNIGMTFKELQALKNIQ